MNKILNKKIVICTTIIFTLAVIVFFQTLNIRPNCDVLSNTSKITSSTSTSGKKISSNKKISDYEKQIIQCINEKRKKNDAKPMKIYSKLYAPSLNRAKEATSLWSHQRPNGKMCYTIMDEYKLTNYKYVAENLLRSYDKNISASQICEAWMKSESHRKAMLRKRYTKCSVAVYYNSKKECITVALEMLG